MPAHFPIRRLAFAAAVVAASLVAACGGSDDDDDSVEAPTLTGRAVLPATTYADGPASGRYLGTAAINGVTPPFARQPVQGFSAVLRNDDGSLMVMADNGYGSIENSADFHLRVYTVEPAWKTASGGEGSVAVRSFIELKDPDRRIPFAITNHFSEERILTGADFDLESMQRAPDGTLWFGDEFGPFLIHTDAEGKVLEAPIRLPDFDNDGREIRSPQNPYAEEGTPLRIMNAVRAHAFANGATRDPVFSPYYTELRYDTITAANPDGVRSSPDAQYARGANLIDGADIADATSEIHDLASLRQAGFKVVPYTVNTTEEMTTLLKAGVDGIISDRPDLLYAAVAAYDADGDGTAGDYLTEDGLIDVAKFDAQGHRGGRNLRPENTLPAFEVALDNLMTTIETDTGITSDGVSVIKHDPYVTAAACRRADDAPYTAADEVMIKDLTVAQIQSTYVCDKLFRGPAQRNDPELSPVAAIVAAQKGYDSPYVLPRTQDLFDLVEAYIAYYESGAGASNPQAARRVANARVVRFNIETKINPRSDRDGKGNVYSERTVGHEQMADTLAELIVANDMEARADIQSFDFRTLIRVQERHPAIRTVYLFGDFPIYNDPVNSDDGTNMQPETAGGNTPWMAGLYWPYRSTVVSDPVRAKRSGGFEGMALSADGSRLYPLLELPLNDAEGNPTEDTRTLLIHEFDLAAKAYTGRRWQYVLEEGGTNIGDFILYNETEGIVIERDGSQGDLDGFKRLYRIRMNEAGTALEKTELVDLMAIRDPDGISAGGTAGDVGLGETFAMPFNTIEDVLILDEHTLLVIDDNNFPFSVGRHVGSGAPDDNELIRIRLPEALELARD